MSISLTSKVNTNVNCTNYTSENCRKSSKSQNYPNVQSRTSHNATLNIKEGEIDFNNFNYQFYKRNDCCVGNLDFKSLNNVNCGEYQMVQPPRNSEENSKIKHKRSHTYSSTKRPKSSSSKIQRNQNLNSNTVASNQYSKTPKTLLLHRLFLPIKI